LRDILLKYDSGGMSPLVAEYNTDIQRLKSQIASFHVRHLQHILLILVIRGFMWCT